MIVELSDRERLAVLFELNQALEVVNESLSRGDSSFAGEDELLMLLIAKLQDRDDDRPAPPSTMVDTQLSLINFVTHRFFGSTIPEHQLKFAIKDWLNGFRSNK